MEERMIFGIDRNFEGGERMRIERLRGLGVVMHKHHFHDFYEVYYMVEGKGTYFINDRIYDIVSGDIIFVPPNTIHSTDYRNNEHERILLEFNSSMIPKFLKERVSEIPSLSRHPGVSEEIYRILRNIDREYKKPDEFSQNEISYLINHLLVTLVRNISLSKVVESRDAVISKAVTFIKENYQSNITLKQVADINFVSPEHLSRTFKKETGFGFNEFVSIVRLQKAEQMLKECDNLSISEIAYALGFNDSNYFSDKFKRAYGVPPLRYRKSFSDVGIQRGKSRDSLNKADS